MIAGAVVLALTAWTVWSIATQFGTWQASNVAYENAREGQDSALAAFESAASVITEDLRRIRSADAVVEGVAGLGPELFAQSVPSRVDAIRLAASAVSDPPDPLLLDQHTVSFHVVELDRAKQRIESGLARIGGTSAALRAAAPIVRTMADVFEIEAGSIISVLAERGEWMLSSRADASQESLAALRTALDAVAASEFSEATSLFVELGAAVAEVVKTSNLARIDDPESILVVVNKKRPLQPQSYVPTLVRANVPHLFNPLLREEAVQPLIDMFDAFHAETGERLRLQNSYRSYLTQVDTYNYHVATKGQAQADRGSARPGHSEHQTGLALDVDGVGYGCSIQQCFGELVHGRWVEQNAWRFGWIVRYPNGFEHITGYDWEPWHLRYVGVQVSTEMHERNVATLEEYFGLEAAPTY